MKYLIYFDYSTLGQHDGKKELIAITDSPKKWLSEHNKQRKADGNPSEKLSDFEIVEVETPPAKIVKRILYLVNDTEDMCGYNTHAVFSTYKKAKKVFDKVVKKAKDEETKLNSSNLIINNESENEFDYSTDDCRRRIYLEEVALDIGELGRYLIHNNDEIIDGRDGYKYLKTSQI